MDRDDIEDETRGPTHLRIGELARRAGVSVRTLHHYHEIGLLEPAFGGAGQQREYGPDEIRRLHRIRSLQSLGLSLATEPVLSLTRRARSLIEEFTGGDRGIERSLGNMYSKEPAARRRIGVEPELGEYMSRARLVLGDTD